MVVVAIREVVNNATKTTMAHLQPCLKVSFAVWPKDGSEPSYAAVSFQAVGLLGQASRAFEGPPVVG